MNIIDKDKYRKIVRKLSNWNELKDSETKYNTELIHCFFCSGNSLLFTDNKIIVKYDASAILGNDADYQEIIDKDTGEVKTDDFPRGKVIFTMWEMLYRQEKKAAFAVDFTDIPLPVKLCSSKGIRNHRDLVTFDLKERNLHFEFCCDEKDKEEGIIADYYGGEVIKDIEGEGKYTIRTWHLLDLYKLQKSRKIKVEIWGGFIAFKGDGWEAVASIIKSE